MQAVHADHTEIVRLAHTRRPQMVALSASDASTDATFLAAIAVQRRSAP